MPLKYRYKPVRHELNLSLGEKLYIVIKAPPFRKRGKKKEETERESARVSISFVYFILQQVAL